MATAILFTGLFVFLAHFFEALFQRTRIPDILLLMILGVILGPLMGVIPSEFTTQVGELLSLATLIVILTESGLGLNLRSILFSAARSLPFSTLAFCGSVAVVAVILQVSLELSWWTAIMAGCILGGTSASVVIPILKNLSASESTTTILTIESALTDVLCIVGALGIATVLAKGGDVQTAGLLGGVAVKLLGACAYGGVLGMLWALSLAAVARLRDARFTMLAFALVVYGSAELIGVSGAIAALAFGVAIGNVPANASIRTRFWSRADKKRRSTEIGIKHVTHGERMLYAEVVFLLKAFFFVYLGTTLEPASFASPLALLALGLAIVTLLPRYPIVLATLGRAHTPRREAMLAIALGPRGMAAAVLAQQPAQLGVPGVEHLGEVVTMMVFFSITICATNVFLISRGAYDRLGAAFLRGFPAALASAHAEGQGRGAVAEAAAEPDARSAHEPEPAGTVTRDPAARSADPVGRDAHDAERHE